MCTEKTRISHEQTEQMAKVAVASSQDRDQSPWISTVAPVGSTSCKSSPVSSNISVFSSPTASFTRSKSTSVFSG